MTKWKIEYVLSNGIQKTEYWSTSISKDNIARSIESLSDEYKRYDNLTIQNQWTYQLVEEAA